MGVFWIFSKTSLTIWFLLLVKKDIVILHMCTKFHVQEKPSSRDIGVKGVKRGQKWGFSGFSQKLANRFGSIS